MCILSVCFISRGAILAWVAYVQVRFTIKDRLHQYLPSFRAACNQGRLIIKKIREAHSRLPTKANDNVANQGKHKFYKRWLHEMCHMGPPVKVTRASYSSIRTGFRGRAIAWALRCREAPVMTFIWYKWNLRLNNCRESKAIQETTLYSVVALSIINDFSACLTFCQF